MNAESRLLKELKATRLERDRAQAAVAAARLAHREALARVQSLALLSPAPSEADVAAAASAVASAARTVASAEGSVPSYRACPLETDILVFHYVLEGPEGTPYAGGFYHGIIQFPPEYPLKPPSVKMLTPSGRFEINQRICLSMSDYHPESWQPTWSHDKILVGLLSFMTGVEGGVGTTSSSDDVKRGCARTSLATNAKNKDFCRLFPELLARHQQEVAESDARASRGSSSSSSSAAGGAEAAASAPASTASTLCTYLVIASLLLAVLLGAVRYYSDREEDRANDEF